MQDFLAFKTFISPVALIIFYYLGAIFMPLFIWFASRWIIKKIGVVERGYKIGKKMAWNSINLKDKLLLALLFVIIFLFMQLLWRMMFEFLIGYMQMRDALVR